MGWAIIKSRFRTIVISPMLQGVNILRTHGTLEMGVTGKSDADGHGKDADEKHTAALRKILLVQAKNPFEKNKRRLCTVVITVQERYKYYTIFV